MQAPIDPKLATDAAEAILKRIIEEAPRVTYSAIEELAGAYAKVMETSRNNEPGRGRTGRAVVV